jgi:peptidoglycan/LPS O-acetylase OafA/YrhL
MRKTELSALTGIRFYAALAVFLSHAPLIPGMQTFSGDYLFFDLGVVGVSFFFVLSGFILTYNYGDLFRSGVSGADYKRFVWDRFTKIYPVHFATMLFMIPLQVLSPNLPLDWRAVPFHLFLLQCFWPLPEPNFYHYLNVPSWSISCEWFFYLLAPMAMFFALGGRRRWVPVIAAAAYALGLGLFLWNDHSDYVRLYFVSWFAPSRFVEFLAGVFLARVFLTESVRKPAAVAGIAQTAGIVLLIAGAVYRQHAPWPFWGGLLYVPGSALIIFGLALSRGRGFLAAHLGRPWIRQLGIASFSFYMIHVPLLRTVRGLCYHFGWEVHSWTAFWAVTVGMFALIQTGAFIVCYGYEMAIQKYLRRLVRQRSSLSQERPLSPTESVDSLPRIVESPALK